MPRELPRLCVNAQGHAPRTSPCPLLSPPQLHSKETPEKWWLPDTATRITSRQQAAAQAAEGALLSSALRAPACSAALEQAEAARGTF